MRARAGAHELDAAVVLPDPAGATTSRIRRPSAASASIPSTRGRSMVPAPTAGTRVFEAMSPRGFDIGRFRGRGLGA